MSRHTCNEAVPLLMIVALIIFGSITVLESTFSQPAKNGSPGNALPSLTPHVPIVIESNSDFEDQGWPGNGSEKNPYRISDLEIASMLDGVCINISNTDVHFVVERCAFPHETYSDADIALQNVQNGAVISCIFSTAIFGVRLEYCSSVFLDSLNLTDSLLLISESSDISVSYCGICGGPGDGILAVSSDSVEIIGNTVSGAAASGVVLEDTDTSLVYSNTFADNTEYQLVLHGSSQGNTVYANHIEGQPGALAYDEGEDNSWDDGESTGNYWSDYSGSGVYTIPGPAGSVDHYPMGPSSTTTTTTTTTTPMTNTTSATTTTTSTTTTNTTTKETVYTTLVTYLPVTPEIRGILVGTFSAVLIGTAMVVALLVIRSIRAAT